MSHQATIQEKHDKREMYRHIIRQLQDDGYVDAYKLLARATNNVLDPTLPPHAMFRIFTEYAHETADNAAVIKDLKKEDDTKDVITNPGQKYFPRYKTLYITSHKDPARCAAFSPDGQLAATGAVDCTIKLLDVPKMHQHNRIKESGGGDDHSVRPVLRTFYDHEKTVNTLDFHPTEPFLVSGSRDCTIKFFEHQKGGGKQAWRAIRETHNVRSIHFHPSGDYLLVGTDAVKARIYDMYTFQAYTSNDIFAQHVAPINCVRYAPDASVYATACKDGSIKIWDGHNNKCVHTIERAHTGAEVSSVMFSPSGKYLLSGGKDSTCRLWDVGTAKPILKYLGCQQVKHRMSTVFVCDGDFVMSSDDVDNKMVAWDTLTGEVSKKLQGHNKPVRCITVSPTENAFLTCSEDGRARYWSAVEIPMGTSSSLPNT